MKNIWRAIRFIPEYRGRVVGVLVVGSVLGAVATVTPQVYKMIVDVLSGMLAGRLSHAEGARRVAMLVGAFFVLRLAVVVFSALQDAQADDLWLDAVSTFRQRVFDNMTGSRSTTSRRSAWARSWTASGPSPRSRCGSCR